VAEQVESAFVRSNPQLLATIGVGRRDITPASDAPIVNWGAATFTRAAGVHLPLTATALSVRRDADSNELFLVSLDLGWWRTQDAFAGLRDAVARRLDIDDSQIILTVTHTHAGPAIDPAAVGPGDRADVTDYLSLLADRVVEAALEARASAAPALLEWGRGRCDLAHVRDQWVPAQTRFICGLDTTAAPDDYLLVGRVTDSEGRIRAVVVNYACHPTTLGPTNASLSPDYVGPARQLVESATGSPMLFLQGASGELSPRRQYGNDLGAASANGAQLGHAVLSTLSGMLPPGAQLSLVTTIESGAPLGVWGLAPLAASDQQVRAVTETLRLPVNDARGEVRSAPGQSLPPAAAAERDRRSALMSSLAAGPGHELEVTVWRLGGAVLVAHPGEAYSHLQKQLRSRFPDHAVVVVNLANGAHHGYLPPADAYDHNLYQVWQTPAGRGSLEQLVEACAGTIELLLMPSEVRR
jgi:hypothetical protein